MMHNDIVERIKIMLQAEGDTPERDSAKIVDYRAARTTIRKEVLVEVLDRCEQVIKRKAAK